MARGLSRDADGVRLNEVYISPAAKHPMAMSSQNVPRNRAKEAKIRKQYRRSSLQFLPRGHRVRGGRVKKKETKFDLRC